MLAVIFLIASPMPTVYEYGKSRSSIWSLRETALGIWLGTNRYFEQSVSAGPAVALQMPGYAPVKSERASQRNAEPSAQVVRATISPASQAWVIQGASVSEASPAFVSVSNVRLAAGASHLCGDDLALLELASPLTNAASASLSLEIPPAPAAFTSVGYGTDGTLSGTQRANDAATIVCVGVDCADPRIAAGEILATSGACEGDSGGPAIARDGTVFAMAVRSRADCGETAYLGFKAQSAWLAHNTADIANAQGIPVPAWAASIFAPTSEPTPTTNTDAAVAPDAARELVAYGGGCSTLTRASRTHAALILLLVVSSFLTSRRFSGPQAL